MLYKISVVVVIFGLVISSSFLAISMIRYICLELPTHCDHPTCLSMPGYYKSISHPIKSIDDSRIKILSDPCDIGLEIFNSTYHCETNEQYLDWKGYYSRKGYPDQFTEGVFIFDQIRCGTSLHRIYKAASIWENRGYNFRLLKGGFGLVVGVVKYNHSQIYVDSDYGICIRDIDFDKYYDLDHIYHKINNYTNSGYHKEIVKNIFEERVELHYDYYKEIGQKQRLIINFPPPIVGVFIFLIFLIVLIFAPLIYLIVKKMKSRFNNSFVYDL